MRLLSEIRTLDQLRHLPDDSFYVTVNGKLVEWQLLNTNIPFEVHLRLRGGKGGFGSLLRSFRIHRSTNQLMCRDLTGRRLADVKEEEKLRRWIERANEREEEKRRRRREKYEKLKAGPPKHDFNDPNYIETREKLLDETDDAFEAGLAALSKDKIGGQCDQRKRAVDKYDEEDEDEFEDLPGPSGLANRKKLERDIPEVKKSKRDENEVEKRKTEENKIEKESNEMTKEDETMREKQTDGLSGGYAMTIVHSSDIKESGEKDGGSVANGDMKCDKHKEAKDFAEVNLDDYNNAESLEELGLDHLKHALEVRRLKCGGSLSERAARLFSVKGLQPEQYPKSVRAPPPKKRN
uniref:Replication stress response regulator SDE2 n=1 Tax=Parascaris univalens TaxID=6257 RepID=A0A915AQX3_PARUN